LEEERVHALYKFGEVFTPVEDQINLEVLKINFELEILAVGVYVKIDFDENFIHCVLDVYAPVIVVEGVCFGSVGIGVEGRTEKVIFD
jgi:hypothetical protein